LLFMEELERKIEACRDRLERLYLRMRAGEDCRAGIMMLSVKLDGLLLRYMSARVQKGRKVIHRA
jgi:hypothetical protein